MDKRIAAVESFFLFLARYDKLLLAVFFSLFIIQRCALIFLGSSHISFPYCDEVSSGVLACDLIDNSIRSPLLTYQFEARSGDSLIEGFLLVPFFKVLGRSLFSLKSLALISAALCLLGWVVFIARYQGIRTALLFTLLFAFPPPMFALLNLTGTIGSHHLINPLMAVHLIVLFKIIEDKKNSTAWLPWFATGFLSGLGTYTFYSYLVFSIFCCIFLLVFRLKLITLRRVLLFAGGIVAGLFPWLLRLYHSIQGGRTLYSMVTNFGIDAWSFVQTFLFTLPDSFGYSYPSLGLGIVSPLFLLFILFLSAVLAACLWHDAFSLQAGSLIRKFTSLSPAALQNIFLITFPLCFLSSVALIYPITPFEYVPHIGFFTRYSVSVYYYRWLHILFPFYFGIAAVGMIAFLGMYSKHPAKKAVVISLFALFLCCSALSSFRLYSKSDFKKLFCYRGYNYDYMANRFIMSDFASHSAEKAETIAIHYPEEFRESAYQCLGEKEILNVLSGSFKHNRFEQMLERVPPPYVSSFIYGAVWRAHFMPEQAFQPFKEILRSRFPDPFYEKWGQAYLGYKYYTFFLNREKVLGMITPAERLFFRDYIGQFSLVHSNQKKEAEMKSLLEEVHSLPTHHQQDTVRGLGRWVGGAMLLDRLEFPDYPLDSRRLGDRLTPALQEAFYEGVGGGFAEVLCQFWRTLLLPKEPSLPLYGEMLDMEWQRCHALMSKLSPSHYPLIERGFWKELKRRSLSIGIQEYLNSKARALNVSW